ncbi:MAG: type VII secretion protein EccCa [Streptosporangiales bacterium]|nr:type VII secretion protein EccCa [Streptosporangiales bacterium]
MRPLGDQPGDGQDWSTTPQGAVNIPVPTFTPSTPGQQSAPAGAAQEQTSPQAPQDPQTPPPGRPQPQWHQTPPPGYGPPAYTPSRREEQPGQSGQGPSVPAPYQQAPAPARPAFEPQPARPAFSPQAPRRPQGADPEVEFATSPGFRPQIEPDAAAPAPAFVPNLPSKPSFQPSTPEQEKAASLAPPTKQKKGKLRVTTIRPPKVRKSADRPPVPAMPRGEIVLQSPPEIPEQQGGDALTQALTYLPMGAMAIGMVGMMAGGGSSGGNPMEYISSGAMAVGMVGMMFGQMARGKGDRKLKVNGMRRDYLRYLSQVRQKARRAAEQQRDALLYSAPAPASLQELAMTGDVWQRTPASPDYLSARFAAGSQSLAIKLVPPETKPVEDLDPLCVGALRTFIRTHAHVPGLPTSVRLSAFTRIVPTGDIEAVHDFVRSLVAQVAVAHSPHDLRISVVSTPQRVGTWDWIKWLPHNGHPTETDAAGAARLIVPGFDWLAGVFEKEFKSRSRWAPGNSPANSAHPFHVVIADGVSPDDESLGEDAKAIVGLDGLTIIDLSEAGRPAYGPPVDQPGVLRLRVTPEQAYRVTAGGETPVGVPDALPATEAEAVARGLAPLVPPQDTDMAPEDPLGKDVSLPDVLGVRDPRVLDIDGLWRHRKRNSRDLLRVPIATGVDGLPVELDVKQAAEKGMGPHGLVVGATGSGKSELLLTLVAALAMTHDSSDLNFVLVDFKGGATFTPVTRLPHVASVITNLSDELPLVDRMRDAISGEVVRRQEALREAGYASLKDYREARDKGANIPPLPTLFIILDEFGELLTAKPEFIELFLQIGRIGRSIGVHLLLSSQRLEEGRLRGLDTYLSYRIGLRTFSAQESRTVLGVGDAYELPSAPGNGYLKHPDSEDLVRFRAYYLGGRVEGSALRNQPDAGRDGSNQLRPSIAPFGPAYIPPSFEPVDDSAEAARAAEAASAAAVAASGEEETLLDVLVDQLTRHPSAPAHQIWLPPLAEPPSLDSQLPDLGTGSRGLTTVRPEGHASLCAVMGIVDKPFDQRRDPLWVDLSGAAGHTAIVGGPQTGKSTAVRTLISGLSLLHTAEEVQFYILDFGGGTLAAMDSLPHVGGVAARLQGDRVRRTVAEVRTVLEQRERMFTDQGIDGMATYRRRLASGEIQGDGFGDVFLVVDGWLTVKQDFEELEGAITALAQRGLNYGIHVIVTTNKWSEFRPAIRDLYGTRLELRLGDPYESEIGRAKAANVPEGSPGRGLTREGLHFLTAVPRIDGQDTADGLPEAERDLYGRIRDAWHGRSAPAVRMLPDVLQAAELPAPAGARIPFGIDENSLSPVAADFGTDPHFLIIGDTESGKSNLLKLFINGLTTMYTPKEAMILFVDYRRSLLDASDVPHRMEYLTSSVAAANYVGDLRGAMTERLPKPGLTAEQLRSRSWWNGPDVYVIVDDYDLVGGGQNPLAPLAEFLPQARDVGLHFVLARAAGGAGRAMFEPVIQRMREMGTPGVILSGSKEEGQLWGGVRPTELPQGRGYFVERRGGGRLVQTAYLGDPQ